MSIERLLIIVALHIALAILAAFLIQHSLSAALKSLKVALKSEFTTDVGRLNLVSMFIITVLIVVFNLHQMLTDALLVDSSLRQDHVTVPVALVGFFFIGSLICVMLVGKKN
jgi:hypothetical protein